MTIKPGEREKLSIKGITTAGITINAYMYAAAVATALNAQDLDLTKIKIKCTLLRAGKQFILMQENLKVLFALSSFLDNAYRYTGIGTSNNDRIVLLPQAAGVKEIALLPIYINLPYPINLRGDDELVWEFVTESSAWSSDLDTSLSYLDVDQVTGYGIEVFTPYIDTMALVQGRSNVKEALGNNVVAVHLIVLDKYTSLTADQVFSSLTLSAHKFSDEDTYFEQLTKRARMFQDTVSHDSRGQSFLLYSGNPLDSVQISMDLNSANVNTGKCFIVVTRGYTDARVMALASVTEQGHHVAMQQKLGIRSKEAEKNMQHLKVAKADLIRLGQK
jgi:hypothetical protein